LRGTRQDRVGAVEPGKFADLVAVAGHSLADIGELERVRSVMKTVISDRGPPDADYHNCPPLLGTRSSGENSRLGRQQLSRFGAAHLPHFWHTCCLKTPPSSPRTTKSLCLQVVGCACWWDAWTFNPPVVARGTTPASGRQLRRIATARSTPCRIALHGRRTARGRCDRVRSVRKHS
jgi:hypothetical protein